MTTRLFWPTSPAASQAPPHSTCFAPLDRKSALVAQTRLAKYPSIRSPGVKRRWFDTSHLKKETGFIKGFKYLWQILKHALDDVYLGLRTAVDVFNAQKTEEHLEAVIRQIEIVKSQDNHEYNNQNLVQIANQVIRYKIESRLDGALPVQPLTALGIDSIPGAPTLQLQKLNLKIADYNAEKTEENLREALQAFFTWVRAYPQEVERGALRIQCFYYQAASAFTDPKLFALFALLRTERTISARMKIISLQEQMSQKTDLQGALHERIDLPQIALWFSYSQGKGSLETAIDLYNHHKTLQNLRHALRCLEQWQAADNQGFNRSNGLKIVAAATDILRGKTKKDLCRECEGYECLALLHEKVEWNWSAFSPLPDSALEGFSPLIERFNAYLASGQNPSIVLQQMVRKMEASIETRPDLFLQQGGDALLQAMQKGALSCVALQSLESVSEERSEELRAVDKVVRQYNKEPSRKRLHAIQKRCMEWRERQGALVEKNGRQFEGEFIRYRGGSFMKQLEEIECKAPFRYEPVALPSSRLESTVERGTAFRPEEGENGYIVTFANPVAPWSHSEIVFAEGAYPVEASCFVRPPEPSSLSEDERSRLTGEFLRTKGFLYDDGTVKPEHLCQQSALWKEIDLLWASQSVYAEFVKTVLATPLPRSFNAQAFIRPCFTQSEAEEVREWIVTKKFTIQSGALLRKDWQSRMTLPDFETLPKHLRPFREWILYSMIRIGAQGDKPRREYLGIGAEMDMIDQYSESASGVKIKDPRLAARMKKIAKRRQKEIQRGMNIFGGASPAFKSIGGEYSKMLATEEEQVRHVRQALIDNYLTLADPNAFLPDEEEPRYRLELHESGTTIYRKWIEDPKGQFSRVKSPSASARDSSGEYIEGEYTHNGHTLVEGRLRSIKGLDKDRLKEFKKGNVIFKSNGGLGWEEDEENGQYFKRPGENPEQAERDERICYPTKNLERYLSNGESEWCGSYAVRMLHSAYFHEGFPSFPEVVTRFERDFKRIYQVQLHRIDCEEETLFEKKHAQALFQLADFYAKRIVSSELGKAYFRDMPEDIRLTPRLTPDMIQEFLMGKRAGLARALGRAAQVLWLPKHRGFNTDGKSATASFYSGRGMTAAVGSATGILKFGFNALAATTGLVADLVTIPHQAYQAEKARIRRLEEAGASPGAKDLALKPIGSLAKRVFWEYLPLHLLKDGYEAMQSKGTSAF
ncbi:MAG: hypothetical protein HY861_02375 [Chlamydiia bacterium]|nr:hypothetical protein [Chlamydiia bacterium]